MPGVRADIIQVHPYRVLDGIVEHLILRRAEDDDLLPGHWQVVTGGTRHDETAVDAAARELAEETGLVAHEWLSTGRVATFYFAPFDAVVLSPVFACRIDAGVEPVLSDEHVEYRWLRADEASTLLPFASHREGVEAVEDLVRRGSG